MDWKKTEIKRAKRIQKSYITKVRFSNKDLSKKDFVKWDMVSLRNLSSTGLLFNYDRIIPVNTHIEFNIMLPISEKIDCFGRVCRVDHSKTFQQKGNHISVFGIATEFTIIDHYTQKLIYLFVEDYFSNSHWGERRKLL